jgi:hypothetical protein
MAIRTVVLQLTACGFALACGNPTGAQVPVARPASPYVILVMTDGFRWQEVFSGADSSLLTVADAHDRAAFLRVSATDRRAVLMPFVWGTMARRGQIFGDSVTGSVARLTNQFKFSYPGYSETLTGYADPRIDSNDHAPNENRTVFEWLNTQPSMVGRVAAFATWKAFGRIFNTARSHLPLFDGSESHVREPRFGDNAQPPRYKRIIATFIDRIRGSVRDPLTHRAAGDYRRTANPKVIFIGYGETDRWAHEGRYGRYLQSAHRFDRYLAELWASAQANPATRDSTTLIVTTDHGRGAGRQWTDHGADVEGADRIWIAVMGPGVSALGVRQGVPTTQAQIAATVAAAVGFDWTIAEPRAAPALPVFSAKE